MWTESRGLGQAEAVSQEEYDVTAYHNVLDQLNTVEGVLNDALPVIKAQLALSLTAATDYNDHRKLSGWMMETKGGKHRARWSQVVGPMIGVSLDHGGYAGHGSKHGGNEPYRARKKIKSWTGVDIGGGSYSGERATIVPGLVCDSWAPREKGPRRCESSHPVDPGFDREIQGRVYDAMNLMRNVNWELNRLRIEMPFDLRQLMSQLNDYASQMGRGDFPDKLIATFKIFEQWQNLRKKVIPKMRQKLKAKIKEAEVTEKVAADKMRKENEETITKKERREREVKRAIKSLESEGAKVSRDNGSFVIVVGDRAVTVERKGLITMANTAKKSVRSMKGEQTYTTQSPPSGGGGGGGGTRPAGSYEPETDTQDTDVKTKAENAKDIQTAEKGEGGTGTGAVAVALALLAIAGQG